VVPASGAYADMAREKARGDARVAEETIRLMRLSHRATILVQQQQAMYWAKQRRNLETEQGEQALIDLDMATCELMSGKLAAAVNQDAVRERKVKILTAMKIYCGLRYLMKYFANFLKNILAVLRIRSWIRIRKDLKLLPSRIRIRNKLISRIRIWIRNYHWGSGFLENKCSAKNTIINIKS